MAPASAATGPSPRAGVIPETWNQSVPASTAGQSMLCGSRRGSARHARGVRPRRLHEVEPQTLAAPPPHNPAGAHAFPLQGLDAGIPDGVVRNAGDVVAPHAKMAQGDRDVRLRPAEAGV